jgi:bacteriocin biosynthesis cyclodehydratase domain-containing protein
MNVFTVQRTLVLIAGNFGAAVGERIRARISDANVLSLVEAAAADLDRLVAASDSVLVALWRPHVALCDRLDDACHRAGVSWSQAVLDDHYLYRGPIVVPGHGPCFRCFRRRFMSHAPAADRDQVIIEAYDENPAIGPAGFSPATAAAAAAGLCLDALEAVPGRVIRCDILHGSLIETRVVPVHGCVRCGPPIRGRTGERFVAHLAPYLDEVLS